MESPLQNYRAQAVRARRLAKSVTDLQIREQLEMAAQDYDEMADRLEEAERPRRQS
jgi:hypothetical protein